ncbi:hypothetical protein KAFR_0A00800 [Kazachstania africana CBS 2517]|uniref:C2H2-type domain-containing protein n=1 Tax=Kazachstania africana (strain ATCC 22294 / BCRC 22015 / CBS 2517 / CECT 1963 / NBRC 1671 / NRRL Y-8276) TaxID=1071382 RepID=H2AMB8_KAZAF|nr:hypothetical protein KAFR_0A00800 [Kazachstania africana CBS 2517]CCF55518.1 hypothetical protein KAFR_0A00800 [Kazachstania africana CBS 2517]
MPLNELTKDLFKNETPGLWDKTHVDEGVVHGHIHNYNNMTYIHGHIHHGHQDSNHIKTENNNDDMHINDVENLDCQHFEFFDYRGQNSILPNNGSNTDNSINNNNNININRTLAYPDSLLFRNDKFVGKDYFANETKVVNTTDYKRRKLNKDGLEEEKDCSCSPKELEVCCDVDHEDAANKEFSTILLNTNKDLLFDFLNSKDDPIALFKDSVNKKQISQNVNDGTNLNTVPRQASYIECGLDCEPLCPADQDKFNSTSTNTDNEDDVFDDYCQICVRNGTPKNECNHFPISKSTNLNGADDSTPSSTVSTRQIHNQYLPNKQTDLQILEDLSNISSLYEIPFAKHMNHHHHHSSSGIKAKDSINLLEPLIKSGSSQIFHKQNNNYFQNINTNNEDGSHNHHHHHIVQLHSHSNVPMVQNDKTFSYERASSIDNNIFTKHPNTNVSNNSSSAVTQNNLSLDSNIMSPQNTIKFNWNFKRDDNPELKCKWENCAHGFDNLIDLQKHLFKNHVPKDESSLCYWHNCDFEGEDLCSLVNHINDQHGINFDMKFVDLNANEKVENKKLENHGVANSKEQQATCRWNNCNLTFNSSEELNAHLESFHLTKGKSKYTCFWHGCNKEFSQRQKIVRHLKVHSGFKPYKCEVCSKCFSSDETLKQHSRVHSGEKPFKCHLCDKSFSVSTSLKIHIRTHTGEKPLECKVCGRRFNESSNLSKHMKTHEHNFKCPICSKGFNTQKRMETHMRFCNVNNLDKKC